MNMKEKLLKLLNAKKEQRDALNKSMIESENKEERAAIGETLKALGEEINEVEEMLAQVDEPAPGDDGAPGEDGKRKLDVLSTLDLRSQKSGKTEKEKIEERAKAFADTGKMTIENTDARAVLISSGKLATPTGVSGINDEIGAKVSSIVDFVKITDASGMSAYKVAYQTADSAAATQTEGAAYNASEPTFAFVEIKPQTEAVLSYISKQARKQTPLNYQQKVNDSALVALRKRAAKIVTDKIVASTINTKLYSVTLNETALRKIAFNYGGDESIVGAATLFINKADLVTLGDVRGSDKKPVYEITPDSSNPNTGIIKDGGLSVPYCINSNLASGTLIYGQPRCFELALFSNYEINVSEDFAFDKGLLAIRGDVELGGDVVVNGGFVVASTAAKPTGD
jgi:HK97 family phage major capsid protein